MDNALTNSTESTLKEENFDLKLYLSKFVTYWWLFLLSLLLCLGLAFLYLRYASLKYKITAKILVEDEKKGGGGLNVGELLGDMSSLLNMKSNVDNEVEILKTREMVEKVVTALDLNITYYREGLVKNNQLHKSPFKVKIISPIDSLKPTSFRFSLIDSTSANISYEEFNSKEKISKTILFDHPFIVKEIGALKISKNPEISFTEKGYKFAITTVDLATAKLQKDLTVSATNKLVTIIDISLNHEIPKKGEEILNKFILGYMEQSIINKNRMADSTSAFIDNRLLLVSQELGDVEGEIQVFKQTNQLADISEQSKLLVTNTNTYAKDLLNLKTQVSIIEALEDYLHDDKNKRVVPISVQLQDLVFSKMVETYNTLLLDRERQLLTSTENNPYINNLDQRIASMRVAMLSNLASTKRSMNISAAQLQKNLDLIGTEIHKVPAHERAYLGLFRQQTIKQELYLFLLKKREEVAVSKTSNISNAKIIDHPKSEPKSYSPNFLLTIAIGFIAGLALPFSGIVLLDFLNDRVQTKEDIHRYAAVPVIGEIGMSSIEGFINNNPKSVIAEQYRALRTNLHFFINKENGVAMLITSSKQGEGKTFTAINLGVVLALSGKKVLLIDLDLRVASLSDKFKLKNKAGLTNYVFSSDTSYAGNIYPSNLNENLFVLPSGILPPNPAETIMKERTASLIEQLTKEFDYIIMDTPPIGLVADAQLLNKYVSMALYVVRQNYTLKKHLAIPNELFSNHKMNKIGIVFNGLEKSVSKGYGEYGYGTEKVPTFFQTLSQKIGLSKNA